MRHEIVNVPVDPTLIPEAAHRFAQQALREHQRAEKDVMKAVEHISSQRQALNALAAIVQADKSAPSQSVT